MQCPICEAEASDVLLDLDAGGFDASRLYRRIRVLCCDLCGHVFSELSRDQYADLSEYYKAEYSVSNLQSPNAAGDIPGLLNNSTMLRYDRLADTIRRAKVPASAAILDVGCATGGFLRRLRVQGYVNLRGVDMCGEYTQRAANDGTDIRLGTAEQIPFDEPMDVVVADQVLEHMLEPGKLFSEARRLLGPDGLLCISVPDAAQYACVNFFPWYLFLLREHIQHFDEQRLRRLAATYGFVTVEATSESIAMLSSTIRLPILTLTFRLGHAKRDDGMEAVGGSLRQRAKRYIEDGAAALAIIGDNITRLPRDVAAYGASRELMLLVRCTQLRDRLRVIFDDIPFKQQQTIGNVPIRDGRTLPLLDPGCTLLITAFAHRRTLLEKARRLGYERAIVQL